MKYYNQIKRIRWTGQLANGGEMRNAYKFLVGKT
jgi:hypothetical protein